MWPCILSIGSIFVGVPCHYAHRIASQQKLDWPGKRLEMLFFLCFLLGEVWKEISFGTLFFRVCFFLVFIYGRFPFLPYSTALYLIIFPLSTFFLISKGEIERGEREGHSQINTGREMAITTPIYKAKYLGASWWSPTCKCPRVDTYCWWDFPRDEVVARRTETLPTFLLVVSRLARGRRRPYRALFERRFWDGVNKAGGVTVMMA